MMYCYHQDICRFPRFSILSFNRTSVFERQLLKTVSMYMLFVICQTPVTETIYSTEWYLPSKSQTPKQILQTKTKYQVHSQLCDCCRISCLVVSQRYSWRCCRGLTEVTACSEDCRHRPGASCSAAVMCSSLAWLGRLPRPLHDPLQSAAGQWTAVTPPAASSLPCHACHVREASYR